MKKPKGIVVGIMMDTKKCPNCGVEVEESENFCTACGEKIQKGSSEIIETGDDAVQKNEKDKSVAITKKLAKLTVLLTILLVVVKLFFSSPDAGLGAKTDGSSKSNIGIGMKVDEFIKAYNVQVEDRLRIDKAKDAFKIQGLKQPEKSYTFYFDDEKKQIYIEHDKEWITSVSVSANEFTESGKEELIRMMGAAADAVSEKLYKTAISSELGIDKLKEYNGRNKYRTAVVRNGIGFAYGFEPKSGATDRKSDHVMLSIVPYDSEKEKTPLVIRTNGVVDSGFVSEKFVASSRNNIYDKAELVSQGDREFLEAKIKQVERQYDVRIGIVTQMSPSLPDPSIGVIANAMLNENYRGASNGAIVLLLLTDNKDKLEWHISTDNAMRVRVAGDEGKKFIRDEMAPGFAAGKFAEGFAAYVAAVEKMVAYYADTGTPFKMDVPQMATNADLPSDLGVGGICIDYSKDKVYSILGREQAISDPNKSGHLRYQYPDMEVVITNNVVTGFISKTDRVKTVRGIHEGSYLQDVLQAYGNTDSKFSDEDSTMYEYAMKSITGKDCLMRFAIKNNRVDYISARVVE